MGQRWRHAWTVSCVDCEHPPDHKTIELVHRNQSRGSKQVGVGENRGRLVRKLTSYRAKSGASITGNRHIFWPIAWFSAALAIAASVSLVRRLSLSRVGTYQPLCFCCCGRLWRLQARLASDQTVDDELAASSATPRECSVSQPASVLPSATAISQPADPVDSGGPPLDLFLKDASGFVLLLCRIRKSSAVVMEANLERIFGGWRRGAAGA